METKTRIYKSNNATAEYKTTMNAMEGIINISKLAFRVDGLYSKKKWNY